MQKLFRVLLLLVALVMAPMMARAADLENTLYLDIPAGRVVIALRPDLAPNHVARIKELVRKGFYDGLSFHRVIPGFMAQTGDPLGNGSGGSGKNIKAEFSKEHFGRGVVGMARSSSPDSADSQFFITLGDAGFLDGKYTIFGQVTSGMEFVDKIKAGSEANNGAVAQPDKIVRAQIAADAKG
ncbi:MAG: peptidyl-prolyl cis-trans isomerase [Rhodospirillales bacterium]|nr:peptidyl-prolyl cis-trans isomerase [Rhodospirillales bacterium]